MTTTETATTGQRVINALAEQTDRKPESIHRAHSLAHDLHMDSLDIIEAVMRVEEACHIEMPDEEVEQIDTVADLIALAERKVTSNQHEKP